MRQAIGLSIMRCWRIKRGDAVPHERWWEGLERQS